jgi:multidrug resistance efflux pump
VFEFLAVSLVTILPDFLIRRYLQGKQLGQDINLFTVWYELRWGISACLILTLALITVIFYYHPSTTNVISAFRTVTILSETPGRVEKVHVKNRQSVEAGELLFTLDASVERAKVETARRRIAEVEAELVRADAELAATNGLIASAESAYDQAVRELKRMQKLRRRNKSVVTEQKLDSLKSRANSKRGALESAIANKDVVLARITEQLPAVKERIKAELNQAQAELAKKMVYAGVAGTVNQFALKPGDIVNPILRPAGLLIPKDSGRGRFQAGFKQISASVLKVGMIAEITCAAEPFTVIPMVIVAKQDVIASGQFRPGDRLVDIMDVARPGSVLVVMETLYEGQADKIPAGSKCVANAYTNNHDLIASGELSFFRGLFYHAVDTLAIVHALILRAQALLLPVQTLVLSGH